MPSVGASKRLVAQDPVVLYLQPVLGTRGVCTEEPTGCAEAMGKAPDQSPHPRCEVLYPLVPQPNSKPRQS